MKLMKTMKPMIPVFLGISLVMSGCGKEQVKETKEPTKVESNKNDSFKGNKAFLNSNQAEEIALTTNDSNELKSKLKKYGYKQPDYVVENVNLATQKQKENLVTVNYYKVSDGYLSFFEKNNQVIQKEGFEPSIVLSSTVLDRLSSNGKSDEWRGETK